MSMKWVKGRTKIMWLTAATSQAFSINSLVYWNGSGALIPADSTSGDHVGFILKAITSASPEYTTASLVPVEVPADKQCVFEATAASLTAAKVGTTMDLTDAVTVNGAANSKNVVTLVKYLSATKGQFVLNSTYDTYRVATS
jgi:hypothetical protein